MADISAIFFILLVIGIAYPAILTAWWLLFPKLVVRAQTRVEMAPWKTFWLGLLLVIALAVPVVILLALPFGPAKFLGWVLLGGGFAMALIGSAGLAGLIGARMAAHGEYSSLGAFVRGAVIMELAAFLPFIGWLFVWIPMLVVSFGATGYVLLSRAPREKTPGIPEPVPAQVS